ncbi:hypothetical protein KQX54_011459 [Cotesia glomerata]|uniref:Uncharacterized protein n=1 Tax=Cotesia glomerata TaxID=32391 RepID=A0AAV7I8M8_COTGL|nr:hypothetical protein KQX54_011459 [Cotesia glomerata]
MLSLVPNLSNNQNHDTYDPLENDETGVLTMDVVAETITDPFEKIDNADISMKLCNPIINLIECLQRFKELNQLIVEVFCTEKTEIYYVPYQYDKITKTKVFPKDSVEIIIFRLLPLLLPCPLAIYSPGKEPYRPKKLNVQEEFLFHAKNEEELNTFLNKRKANCTLYGLSEQPLSVIVGETFESIVKYYLIINNIRYEASSVRDVIDLNFKSCFSFQLAFSKIALYPWLVLQQRIYDTQGETDEVRPSVSTFITTLKSNG